jgi:hypothetical protein
MEKIPTAEEFLELQHETVPSIEFDIRQVMIEFAKMHVEAALKESVKCLPYDDKMNQSLLDSRAILNSYPLENIK